MLYNYSQEIQQFTQQCLGLTRSILSQEVGLQVKTSRFLYKGYLYPLKFEIFSENKSTLGFFSPETFAIGLNIKLMSPQFAGELIDVIRHELAHYLVWLRHGEKDQVKDHGPEFKALCQEFGWSEKVQKSSFDLSALELEQSPEQSKIIEKVEKLLKLADSSNAFEAESATLKANKLMLKHNIESPENQDQDKLFAKTVLEYKRVNPKLRTISEVLSHFLVMPVLSHYHGGGAGLLVYGSKSSLELADYIAHFLDIQLDRMWKQAQKEYGLKGLKEKNSYFYGVARGYRKKMMEVEKEMMVTERGPALVHYKLDLQKKVNSFLKLRQSSSNQSLAENSLRAGEKAGRNLSINRPLNKGGEIKSIGYQ